MEEKVAMALNQIRPILQRDGGDIELVEVTEDGENGARVNNVRREF